MSNRPKKFGKKKNIFRKDFKILSKCQQNHNYKQIAAILELDDTKK